jgi:hypothetical protein
MKLPYAIYVEHGHYTHHCPQISNFKQMKDSMNAPCPLALSTPQQAPQQYLQKPPTVVLQNPISHQGVMDTQKEVHPSPPQMGQYQNPGNPVDCTILLTSEEDILLETHNIQYSALPEYTPTT